MVRLIKTLAGILATILATELTCRHHGTTINGNDAPICKLCEKAEEKNLHMLCECTIAIISEVVTERKSWIRSMRKIVKDNLKKHLSTTQYAAMHDGAMECG